MRIHLQSWLGMSAFLGSIGLINADTQYPSDISIYPFTITQHIDLDMDNKPDRIITFHHDKQGGNLIYHPQDKNMQLSASGQINPEAQQAQPAVPATTAPSQDLVRSRDAFRSRDREVRQ